MLTLLSAAGLVKFVRRPSDNLFVFVENPNLAGIKIKVLVCDKKMTLAAWQTRHTSFCSTLCRTLDYSRVAFVPTSSALSLRRQFGAKFLAKFLADGDAAGR